jgi:hypothetical protein
MELLVKDVVVIGLAALAVILVALGIGLIARGSEGG